jgi:replicative DNA helicase
MEMEKPITFDSTTARQVLTTQSYDYLRQKTNEERKRAIQAIKYRPLTAFISLKSSRGGGYICPLCGSGNGSHKTGALMISRNNQVTCFSCGGFDGAAKRGTDTLGALCIIEHKNIDEILKDYVGFEWKETFNTFKEHYLQDKEIEHIDLKFKDGKTLSNIPIKAKCEPDEIKADFSVNIRNSIERLWKNEKALDYLRKRGLTDETIRKYRLGFDNGYIFIPYPDINSYAIKRATFTDGSGKKYRKPSSKIAGREPLFGENNLVKGAPVFIVEGPFDAMSVDQCGGVAVALVTTGITSSFERALSKIPREKRPLFILALDNDEEKADGKKPGQDGQERLKAYLDSVQAKYIEYPISSPYKDANELLQANESQLKANIEKALRKCGDIKNGE